MPRAAVVNLNGPNALRALAGAFMHLDDFDRFVAGLQSALEKSQLFERTTIAVDRTLLDGNAHFSPGTITLPLGSGDGPHGTLQVQAGGKHGQFGPADLH